MQEQRVNYNTAVLAKEKGFDIVVSEWYDETGVLIDETSDDHVECMYDNGDILCFRNGDIPNISTAPTQSLLQKWLRDVHGINNLNIYPVYRNSVLAGYGYWKGILGMNNLYLFNKQPLFPTYEEALEQGLFEELNLLP